GAPIGHERSRRVRPLGAARADVAALTASTSFRTHARVRCPADGESGHPRSTASPTAPFGNPLAPAIGVRLPFAPSWNAEMPPLPVVSTYRKRPSPLKSASAGEGPV